MCCFGPKIQPLYWVNSQKSFIKLIFAELWVEGFLPKDTKKNSYEQFKLRSPLLQVQPFSELHIASVSDTLDGQNPAPVDMVNIPWLTWFCTSQVVVGDFFHQLVTLVNYTLKTHENQISMGCFWASSGSTPKICEKKSAVALRRIIPLLVSV